MRPILERLKEITPNAARIGAASPLSSTASPIPCARGRRDLRNDLYRGKRVFWSRSYCIVSCGGAPLSVINQYVEQQAEPP
jgi:REP-associated tyrosine transposase